MGSGFSAPIVSEMLGRLNNKSLELMSPQCLTRPAGPTDRKQGGNRTSSRADAHPMSMETQPCLPVKKRNSSYDLVECHFMTDGFHFMPYESHFMTEPTDVMKASNSL